MLLTSMLLDKYCIGIVGQYEVGKTTLAKTLESESLGYEVAFADDLKHELAHKFDGIIPGHKWYEKPTEPLIRNMLNSYGQLVKEHVDKNYWIEKVYQRVKACDYDKLIFSDCRFIPEAKWIKLQPRSALISIGPKPTEPQFDLIKIWDLCSYHIEEKPGPNSVKALIQWIKQKDHDSTQINWSFI